MLQYGKNLSIDIMIPIYSQFSTIAEVHKLVCKFQVTFSAVSDAKLMGVIANVQGIAIVNRSHDWTSYTDCSVTSVGHACLFTMYSYILVLISVIVIYKDLYCC